jgi:UDP-glucose 4-epimerase
MNISGGRFLLTGGNGLIGLNIADELLKKGAAKVVLFDNMVSTRRPLRPTNVSAKGTILRLNQLLEATKDVDGIFHLAAYLTFPLSGDPNDGIDVSVTGCQNVLDAARWYGVRKVTFSSSIAVCGDGNSMTTETAPSKAGDLAFRDHRRCDKDHR